MSTLGQRLYRLRKDKKLARDALGSKIGVSKTSVKNWEDDENPPKFEHLQAMAEFFGCSIEYLTDGIGDGDNFKVVKRKPVKYVPVLNYTQAGEFCEYHDDAITDEFEPVSIEYSDRVYWVVIEGSSMQPDFYENDLVLIDPDAQPNPSDFVLALKSGEKKSTFKRYRPKGFDEETKEEFYHLVPSNPDYPIIDSRFVEFSVCGVAVEHRKKLR